MSRNWWPRSVCLRANGSAWTLCGCRQCACSMSMGGKGRLKHTATSRVQHVVGVTDRRQLFLGTSVTPIFQAKNLRKYSLDGGTSQSWVSEVLGHIQFNCWRQRREKESIQNTPVFVHGCFRQHLNLLLSASVRFRTVVDTNILLYLVCTSLLCARPIAGCSAVLTVRW